MEPREREKRDKEREVEVFPPLSAELDGHRRLWTKEGKGGTPTSSISYEKTSIIIALSLYNTTKPNPLLTRAGSHFVYLTTKSP